MGYTDHVVFWEGVSCEVGYLANLSIAMVFVSYSLNEWDLLN